MWNLIWAYFFFTTKKESPLWDDTVNNRKQGCLLESISFAKSYGSAYKLFFFLYASLTLGSNIIFPISSLERQLG